MTINSTSPGITPSTAIAGTSSPQAAASEPHPPLGDQVRMSSEAMAMTRPDDNDVTQQ